MNHEYAHSEVCPYELDYFEDIYSGIAQGLRNAGVEAKSIQEYTQIVANIFTDLIVNGVMGNSKEKHSYIKGGLLFFIKEGVLSKEMQSTRAYSPLYSLFANLNLKLWGTDSPRAQFVERYFDAKYQTLKTDTQKAIEILLQHASAVLNHRTPNRCAIIQKELSDFRGQKWHRKAQNLAELIAPLLETVTEEHIPDNFFTIQMGTGFDVERKKANQKVPLQKVLIDGEDVFLEVSNQPIEGQVTGVGQPIEKGDHLIVTSGGVNGSGTNDENGVIIVTDKQLPDSLTEDSRAADNGEGFVVDTSLLGKSFGDGYNEQFRKQMIGIGLGKGHSTDYASEFERWDKLYEERAKEIPIEIEEKANPDSKTPIAYLIRERLNSNAIRRISWTDTRIYTQNDGRKQVELYTRELPYEIEDPSEPTEKGIPDLAFIIDTSGSMEFNPEAGTGSYDLLLRANYSIFKWLHQAKKASFVNYAVINFSGQGSTLFTGWRPYTQMRQIKEMFFHKQDGGTYLDQNAVRQLYQFKKDNFLAIMTTDGAIGNSEEVEESIFEMIHMHGNHFVMLQIGPESELAKSLKARGVDVQVIDDPAFGHADKRVKDKGPQADYALF
jgi:hypothetical protein